MPHGFVQDVRTDKGGAKVGAFGLGVPGNVVHVGLPGRTTDMVASKFTFSSTKVLNAIYTQLSDRGKRDLDVQESPFHLGPPPAPSIIPEKGPL